MSGWWGSKLFLLVWMPAGIEPAGTASCSIGAAVMQSS